jgi:hypothetical protein
MRTALIAGLLALLSACTDVTPRGGGDILVLGDSVMAWNGSQAIPEVIEATLDRPVTSKAVPGAQFDNPSGVFGAVGFDVRRQFPGGQWNWIVLNGGANDLSNDCSCGACASAVSALAAPGGAGGSIPAFMSRLRAQTGAQVLWMGYYKGNGRGSFEGCRPSLVELERRIAAFAATREGIYFIDSEAVIDPSNPGHFAPDNNHPSVTGSALIGRQLARFIAERSQTPR